MVQAQADVQAAIWQRDRLRRDFESNNHVNYDGEVAPIRVGHLSKRAPLLVEKESLPFRRSSRLTTSKGGVTALP